MNIYIDESGVFKPIDHSDAWSAVVAYVVPKSLTSELNKALTCLKLACGRIYRDEVKLADVVDEQHYFRFLDDLQKLPGTLYGVAMDMSHVDQSDIIAHRDEQTARIREHLPRVVHEPTRLHWEAQADRVGQMSLQLYAQLTCQVLLINQVINRAIWYYVQRFPSSLRVFRWKIDQKNTTRTEFEMAFEELAPGFLQTISWREPANGFEEDDYSAMRAYIYTEEDAPTYLRDQYGIEKNTVGSIKLSKILRDNLSFPDSRIELGVQVADLLASGVRRCLRGRFRHNRTAALKLGHLMVRDDRWALGVASDPCPIRLATLSMKPSQLGSSAIEACNTFQEHARNLLKL